MKKILATLGILSVGGVGAADVASFNPRVLPDQAHDIANERVEVKQIGNEVRATLPWKGEKGLTVKVDMGRPTASERLKDRRNKEVITEVINDDFKIDFILNEKPDINRFCQQFEGHEDYDFFYQPPLTQEEIAEGAQRPENVVGSYAVYHKTLRDHKLGETNYETGKAFHIYRPQVWSLSTPEIKEWAELNYTDGELCVTVPQTFLDSANYPVRVDPTFGYDTAGGSSFVMDNDVIGTQFTLSESGTASKMTYSSAIAIDNDDNQSETNAAFFLASDDSFVASTSETTVSGQTQTWYDATFSPTVELSAITYWLVASADNVDSDQALLYFDTDASVVDGRQQNTGTYPNYPDPWTPGADGDRKHSIYATYIADEPTVSPTHTLTGDIQLTGDIILEQ